MAEDPNKPKTPEGWKRLYIWSRPVEGKPDSSTAVSPAAYPAASQAPGTAARDPADGKGDPKPVEFQANFPEQRRDARPSVVEVAKTIKKEDFLNIAQVPCARQGLLTGITAGAAVGGLRWVWIGSIRRGANWAVGAFAIASIASFEFCQYKRYSEKAQMKRTVEVIQEKRGEVARKQREELTELRREEEVRSKSRPWYKFW